jgi:hypothetical protein
MRNMTAVAMGVIVLVVVVGGCTGDPQFAKYTSNSQCVLIGISPDRLIVHHIPSGTTSECKGSIQCEDSSGTRWVTRNKEQWALIQLGSEGKITRKDLPVVQGKNVAFEFGPGPDQISAGVGDPDVALVHFYCLRIGQSKWNPAQPPPTVQNAIRARLSGGPIESLWLFALLLRFDQQGSGSRTRVITQSLNGGVAEEVVRIDSPDSKTFVTLKVKKDHLLIWDPEEWFYRECEFTVTDIASGKTRVISNQFGELLFDRILAVIDNCRL